MGGKGFGFRNAEFGENVRTFGLRCDQRSDQSDRVRTRKAACNKYFGRRDFQEGHGQIKN